MAQYVDNVHLESHTCGECGIVYAGPVTFFLERRNDKKTFYCINGHRRVYRESTEEKLKKELERNGQMLEAARAKADTAELNLSRVTKAHNRMRDRIVNGVCPCCTRSFGNLREHMKNEHPEFGAERESQPFGLELHTDSKGRTLGGNCDLCFLKPAAQILSLIAEKPERAIWWAGIESYASETFAEKRSADGWRFRNDRPSYAQMAQFAADQRDMFDPDEEAIACFCGD